MEKEKLFVLGDSVSIHYGPYLKESIKDKFNYDRKRGIKQSLEDLDKVYFDHVHFKEEVRSLQGAFIGGYLNCLAEEN